MPYFLLLHRALLFILASLALSTFQAHAAATKPPSNPVILFSLDGFRYDYLEKYYAPHLEALARTGVRAKRMHPVYPTKTFPNHLSIITGMYPSNHGLIHNQFYDRQLDDVYKMGKAQQQPLWLQATPLWTYAEQHQVRTATYFWPESDAEVDGVLPTYYFPYNKLTPYQERIDQIISWLKLPEEKRPQFITGYFSLVDSMGHKFGPDSKEVSDAVTYVDRYIGRLKKRLEQEIDFPVNLVIVSDHGMVETHSNRKIQVSSLLNLDDFKTIVSSTQLMLYAKEGIEQTRITQVAEHLNTQSQGRYSSYTKTQWPGILHYNNNDRIPDIVLEPIPPITFTDKRVVPDIVSGTHGFNPYTVPEMGAIFIANGPDFKQGMIIPAFENIHVFPVLIRLLGLAMPDNVDADPKVLESIFIN